MMEKKVRLSTLNPCITCVLCKGYLIDATTITECLHTFCKTCIVQYLKDHTHCPVCKQLIHQSHPRNYISHDRTMQDIVFKLVPGLQENERQQQVTFYQNHGLDVPLSLAGNDNGLVSNNQPKVEPKVAPTAVQKDPETHKTEEQVNVCLEVYPAGCPEFHNIPRRYIRCSYQATVTHLKKYISLKLHGTVDKYREVEILCNNEVMGKDHTLKFITVTRWRGKGSPLALHYRTMNDSDLN